MAFNEEKLLKLIRANLRKIREASGLSQSELARRMGVSASYICDLERGRRRGITTHTQARLCDVLGVSPTELVDEG